MAASGNLTIAANVTGGLDGARSFGPITITTAAAITQTVSVALIVGATTVSIPTSSTAVVFFPPNAANPLPNPTFAGTLTLKGISSDTGIVISNKFPTEFTFDALSTSTSFVITSTATGTATAWFM